MDILKKKNDKRRSKLLVAATMDVTGKTGKPRKGWNDETELDLKIMKIRNWRRVARDRKECRELILEYKVHNGQ
jgi:IS4 transposase